MADRSTKPAWDPLILAGQLHTIAKQSQSLMQRFAANQADATRIGMGDTSTLGFDFVDLMTKMMSDPTPVAKAQINLFNDNVALWQKAAERMWMMRLSEPDEGQALQALGLDRVCGLQLRQGELPRRREVDSFGRQGRQGHE